MVHCHNATATSIVTKVWGEVFAHFCTVAAKCHSSMWASLACKVELFVNNLLDAKENDELTLGFALHPSHLFSLSEFGLFHSNTCVWPMISAAITYLISVRVYIALFS
jgi:hypothetical protein